MSTIYEIPLTSTPQTFNITLGGTTYEFALYYRNVTGGGWTIDISDANGNPIVTGIPMVTGTNLLKQYAYLGFQGGLWVQTTSNPDAVPTFQNLGTDGKLYWVTTP